MSTTSDSTAIFAIEGMTCGACVASITTGLEGMPGVSKAAISLVTERGAVDFDSSVVSPEQLLERIDDCGFNANLLTVNKLAHSEPGPSASSAAFQQFTTIVAIEGMTCGACVASITSALDSMPGVENAAISLVTERGAIEHSSNVSPEAILERIEDCGFDAVLISSNPSVESVDAAPQNIQSNVGKESTLRLKVYGMTCASCTMSVENALLASPGVKEALVSLALEEVSITYDPSQTGPRTLVETVEAAGFNAILATSADNSLQLESLSRVKSIAKCRNDFLICLTFGIPVIILSKFVPGLFPFFGFLKKPAFPGLYWDDIVNFFLTLPIQFGVGYKFYTNTYKALSHRSPTMDVLVCISTSCAFFFSIFSIFYSVFIAYPHHPATLWETSAMLITFITGGKYLENKAKGQTSVALSRLISLSPSSATIYVNPGKFLENVDSKSFDASAMETRVISTDLLQPGDITVLLPGEKVPADGIVVSGESYVDESLITGESMPVTKTPGDSVICGSINGHGRMDIRVVQAGNDTKLAHIVQLVQSAQTSKTQVQRYADYIAGFFVPCVILLSLVTFLVWLVLSHSMHHPPKVFEGEEGKFMVCLRLCISVIVVACPCALGLATPTAVMVGTGVGASNGILIKGGDVLETASSITTVLFDKTGTLTTGKMSLIDYHRLATFGPLTLKASSWWTLLGAVEANSEHPIARGIVAKARTECGFSTDDSTAVFPATVSNFKVLVGKGVTASVCLAADNVVYSVIAGNRKLLDSENVSIPEENDQKTSAASQTIVFIAVNGHYAGYVALSDTLRPQAQTAVDALVRLGYDVGIVSGDNPSVVARVAKQLGIPRSRAWGGVSPEGKLQIIEQLQSNDPELSGGDLSMDGRRGGKPEVVAFVGDGINDSPALAQAALGISIAGATDAAMEAADIVLIKEDPLLDVPAAFHLSRTTFRRIKINLCWAFIYNIFMIPVAMGMFLPFGVMLHPVLAGASMAFSSVSVIVSSLLLQFWRCPEWIWPVSRPALADTDDEETGARNNYSPVAFIRRLFRRSRAPSYELLSHN